MKSGHNDRDVVRMAVELFEQENGKPWTLDHAWRMLKQYPKWQESVKIPTESRGKKKMEETSRAMESDQDSVGKRGKLNDGGYSTPNTDDGEGLGPGNRAAMRPMGNRAAKAAAATKKKGYSSGGVCSSPEVIEGFTTQMQLWNNTSQESLQLEREKYELNKKKEERKAKQLEMTIRQTNMKLLHKLLDKEMKVGMLTEAEEACKATIMKDLGME